MPSADALLHAPAPVSVDRPQDSLRRPLRIAALVLLCLSAALGVVAWRASELILHAGDAPTLREQRVLAAGPGWVRLSRDRESVRPGTWALQWRDGFGWLGRVVAMNDAGVVREFRALSGTPPVRGWASVRGVARNADPRTLLGVPFAEVHYESPLGPCPAWLVPGADTTWVLCLHGLGAERSEGLRTVAALASDGLPILLIAYRGDAGAPQPAGGFSHLGGEEWADLEGAARFALDHGARRLVLVGYSMGGQIVMQFLAQSALSARVGAVVLESPVLDWNACLAYRARVLGVPEWARWLGQRAATLRAGIEWDALDRVEHTGPFSAPVLLLHARGDRFAPPASSEAFARRHPGNVRLVVLDSGDHVEAWNVDPLRYRALLLELLSRAGLSARGPARS